MNSAPHRVPPVVIAALVNILLFIAALVLGAASILPADSGSPPARAAQFSSEDPPPLAPVQDPDPREPQPVQQIVRLGSEAAVRPVAFTPSAGGAPETLR